MQHEVTKIVSFKKAPIFSPEEPEIIATEQHQPLGSEEGISERREIIKGNPKFCV